MKTALRLEGGTFANAAPAVRYEVDASDAIISVNDAWQSFAIANGAPHLMRERILGRSIWDFVSDDTTRLVYDVILRQVRNGGRSRFEYRCDSPERRRLMAMTIVPGHAGHVIFESATVCVEWHREPPIAAEPTMARCCGWCKRAHGGEHGWVELGAQGATEHPRDARKPVITGGMCSECYSRVMNSVDDTGMAPAVIASAPRTQRLEPARAAALPSSSRRGAGRTRPAAIASRHAS